MDFIQIRWDVVFFGTNINYRNGSVVLGVISAKSRSPRSLLHALLLFLAFLAGVPFVNVQLSNFPEVESRSESFPHSPFPTLDIYVLDPGQTFHTNSKNGIVSKSIPKRYFRGF